MQLLVYVAGPVHGSGTQPANLRAAITIAHALLAMGYVPFVPHLYLLWEFHRSDVTEADFQKMCDAFLERCHILVRFPGESPGSDLEVAKADQLGIPVVVLTGDDTDQWVLDLERVRETQPSVASFDEFQDVISEWLQRQPFGRNQQPSSPALGVVEEIGELRGAWVDAMETRAGSITRAVLKGLQGIRGTAEEHAAKMADAIGDIMVYTAGFATSSGKRLRTMANVALKEILRRDWERFPVNGVDR